MDKLKVNNGRITDTNSKLIPWQNTAQINKSIASNFAGIVRDWIFRWHNLSACRQESARGTRGTMVVVEAAYSSTPREHNYRQTSDSSQTRYQSRFEINALHTNQTRFKCQEYLIRTVYDYGCTHKMESRINHIFLVPSSGRTIQYTSPVHNKLVNALIVIGNFKLTVTSFTDFSLVKF